MTMTVIQLDAGAWSTEQDMYDSLLISLRAPDWHGKNIHALIDSMVVGQINRVEPPYRVEVRGLSDAGSRAKAEFLRAFDALREEGATCQTTGANYSIEVLA